MKKQLILLLALTSLNLFAETFVTRIHSMHEGEKFIRLENGRVAFLVEEVKRLPRGSKVKVTLNQENQLEFLELLEEINNEDTLNKNLELELPPTFKPTILPDLKTATERFNGLQADFKRVSECSDRAHVWSYDMFKNNGVLSQKVFALFTASYINRNHFKWWFHVAPLVSVQEGPVVEQRVMDFRYTDRPLKIKEWTDLLVFSKRPCKMTTKFSEYDVNPQTEDCYMIIESMYYRLPGDIFDQERKGVYRDRFYDSEVNFARKLGFDTTAVRSAP